MARVEANGESEIKSKTETHLPSIPEDRESSHRKREVNEEKITVLRRVKKPPGKQRITAREVKRKKQKDEGSRLKKKGEKGASRLGERRGTC